MSPLPQDNSSKKDLKKVQIFGINVDHYQSNFYRRIFDNLLHLKYLYCFTILRYKYHSEMKQSRLPRFVNLRQKLSKNYELCLSVPTNFLFLAWDQGRQSRSEHRICFILPTGTASDIIMVVIRDD